MDDLEYDEQAVMLQNWNDVFENSTFPADLSINEDYSEPPNVSTKKSEKKVNFDVNRVKPKINLEILNEKLDFALRRFVDIEEKIDQLSSELTWLTKLSNLKLLPIDVLDINDHLDKEKPSVSTNPDLSRDDVISESDSKYDSNHQKVSFLDTDKSDGHLVQFQGTEEAPPGLKLDLEIIGEIRDVEGIESSKNSILERQEKEIQSLIEETAIIDEKDEISLDIKLKSQDGEADEIIELTKSDIVPEAAIIHYKPFYNKENYTCSENYTCLQGNNFKSKLIILGDSDKIIIYPFGKNKIDQHFQRWIYQGDIRLDQHVDNLGIMYFSFYPIDDIYVMEPETDYYETLDDDKIPLSSLDRPFTIFFNFDLE